FTAHKIVRTLLYSVDSLAQKHLLTTFRWEIWMTDALRRRVLTVMLSFCALLYAGSALAADEKTITARATGAVISQSLCDTTVVCQVTVVSGLATYLGHLTGLL